MTDITIIGAGNMGAALAARAVEAGHNVQVLARDAAKAQVSDAVAAGVVGEPMTGSIVVLALPYSAVAEVLAAYEGQLDGRVLVDITNPLNFETFDELVVGADSSAAAEIAAQVPGVSVLKALNTNFAATLASGEVAGLPTTVLIAGDDAEAKSSFAAVLESTGLRAVDAGSLKRARELEALGFLQLTLAAGEKTSWTTGFALAK